MGGTAPLIAQTLTSLNVTPWPRQRRLGGAWGVMLLLAGLLCALPTYGQSIENFSGTRTGNAIVISNGATSTSSTADDHIDSIQITRTSATQLSVRVRWYPAFTGSYTATSGVYLKVFYYNGTSWTTVQDRNFSPSGFTMNQYANLDFNFSLPGSAPLGQHVLRASLMDKASSTDVMTGTFASGSSGTESASGRHFDNADVAFQVVAGAPTTITSLNRVNSGTTNLSTVNWTLTFAAANTGVTASNFSLSGAAAAGATVGSPTTSNGGLTWNVPVTTGSTDGPLTLSFANATGTSPGVSTTLPFAGQSYTMDKMRPTISIGSPSVSSIVAGAGVVTYTVTYADTNFSASTLANANITVNTTGSASATLGVSGSGNTRTVTLSSIAGVGTLGISIAAGTASDTAGNTTLAAGPSTTFTVAPPAPTVTAISPSTGSTAGGMVVTITGTDIAVAPVVTIGGNAATGVTVVNATTITCTTPAGTAGARSVVVTTPGGSNVANTLFTYVAPPTVTSLSPATGTTAGGTGVTITGTNLTGATAVTIGGVAATSVLVSNATTLTAVTPAGTAGTASVLVTTSGGTNAANTLYTYNSPPVASPASYSRATGTSLKIRISTLLASSTSDPEDNPRALQSVGTSAQGAGVAISGSWILYNPVNNASDSFTYTVTDGYGHTATASIAVTVVNEAGASVNFSLNGLGQPTMQFAGIPGYRYTIQRSTNLSEWNDMQTFIAPANGVFSFIDVTDPRPPTALYRMSYTPAP